LDLETTGRPVRLIVVDFELHVNDYASLGRDIPHFKPSTCPECGRARTLLSHGLRRRLVRVAGELKPLFVRRIKCLARQGCRVIFTVLPSFLHSRRRCWLPEVAPLLEGRFVEELSLGQIARRFPSVASSTMRELVRAFTVSAPAWLTELCQRFASSNPEMVLVRDAEKGGPRGLVAMAVHALDWFRSARNRSPLDQSRWLEELCLWGSVRPLQLLLSPHIRAGP
jgi:hypothetical protein